MGDEEYERYKREKENDKSERDGAHEDQVALRKMAASFGIL